MGTLQTWRKAYGALKDTTKVGLAHVNSDYAVKFPSFVLIQAIEKLEERKKVGFLLSKIGL